MGTFATNKRENILIYNSQTSLGKQTIGFVEASDNKVLEIDISKTKVTGTQWAEIADGLNMHISDLVEKEHPDFVKNYGKGPVELDDEDWIKVLENHPEVVTYPIVIRGGKFLQIKTPSDFARHLKPNSAGIGD